VVRLHYWASSKTFRLDAPTNEPPSYVVDVKIEAAPQERPVAWQWLDLPPSALASAMDLNWHSFAPEHSEAIEQASRATMGRVEIIIGLTKYVIQNFNGAYAEQRNERTGARRSVRRGYASDAAPPAAPDDLASDFCGRRAAEPHPQTTAPPRRRLPETKPRDGSLRRTRTRASLLPLLPLLPLPRHPSPQTPLATHPSSSL